MAFPNLQERCSKLLADKYYNNLKPIQHTMNHMCFDIVFDLALKRDLLIWKENFKYIAVEIKKDDIEDIYAEPTMVCGDYVIDVWVKFRNEDDYTIYTQYNDDPQYEYYYTYCINNELVNGW
jgi:hypothetical protein